MRIQARIATAGGAEPGRRRGEHVADGVVELPDARESGGERDVGCGQVGRLEQDPRGLRPLGSGERYRAGADLGDEDPVQLPFGVAQPPGEARNAFPVDDAVGDQPQRSPGQVARTFHSGEPGEASGRHRLQAR